MGMFDHVQYSAPCYKCGALLTGWQSKDGPCSLLTLKPEEVRRFYDNCNDCGSWNEYRVTAHVVTVERVPVDEEENEL